MGRSYSFVRFFAKIDKFLVIEKNCVVAVLHHEFLKRQSFYPFKQEFC
jgi:hypothetical protein